MEVVVGGHERLELAGLRELLLECDGVVEADDQGVVMLLREQADDLELQRLAQEMRLLGAGRCRSG
ncbi:hypothetical protein BRDID11002_58430 [Bradyrhizobium diazoefficiens]